MPHPVIVGLGEALFDVFPDREVLGGAPLNAAVHAHQLAAPAGGCGVPASRIGADGLGRRLREQLAGRGVPTEFLQEDAEFATGRVMVDLREGEPQYEIVRDAAWDRLEFTPNLQRLAETCDAVCFGTLAQRSERSRQTIRLFVETARSAVRLFDVNLRQDFFSPAILRESCRQATIVKLNQDELERVHRLLDLSGPGPETEDESLSDESRQRPSPQDRQAVDLLDAFALQAVVVTQGAAGTALYGRDGRTARRPIHYDPSPDADSVGAGDACTAGILWGLLQGWPPARTVELADHLGAYVASQPGATPRLPDAVLQMARPGT